MVPVNREAEYVSQRASILSVSQRKDTILYSSLGLAVAVIAYGLDKSNPIIVLSSLLVLTGAYKHVRVAIGSMRRLAAYQRVFHQDTWEEAVYRLRHVERKRSAWHRTDPNFVILWASGALASGAAWIALKGAFHGVPFWTTVVTTIAWLFMFKHMRWQNRELRGGGTIEERFHEEFKTIFTALTAESTAQGVAVVDTRKVTESDVPQRPSAV